MKKLEQKFNELSQNVHLTESEKNAMRDYLLEYIGMQPAIHTETAATPRTDFLSYFTFKPAYAFAALALVFIGTGSVSLAAQNALPGDVLYPVKVSVNEKVAGALAISDDAKASYETALADTRLTEAEALAAKGTLSTTTEATLQAAVTAHTEAAKAHIAELEVSDSEKAVADRDTLTTVLSAHEHVLAEKSYAGARGILISAIRSERSDEASGSVHVTVATAATLAAPVSPTGATSTATSSLHTKKAASFMHKTPEQEAATEAKINAIRQTLRAWIGSRSEDTEESTSTEKDMEGELGTSTPQSPVLPHDTSLPGE